MGVSVYVRYTHILSSNTLLSSNTNTHIGVHIGVHKH
jgi:hypothetical protein